MKQWLKVTLILCAFGTLREIRPSEPFVSNFLSGPWRNVTSDQLFQEVYPVGTYSYLALLCVIFLITDFFRFKPIIIVSGLSGIAVYAILLWTTSLEWLQASQFFYGLYMATEVAYYTYIFAKVDPDKYPKVSSYTRMAALVGRFLSGISSQLLVMFNVMDYRDLNYITFAAQIAATSWAIWLPPVQYSIYFHRKAFTSNHDELNEKTQSPSVPVVDPHKQSLSYKFKEASVLIAKHSRTAYTRVRVVAWSALYACALALFVQAQNYIQILWIDIQTEEEQHYNGFVEASQTILGAGAAFVTSVYSGTGVPAFAAAIQAIAVFLGTHIRNVYVSYAGYIVMGMMYHYIITLSSTKIAGYLSDESCFGLIFGINTLIGISLQSLLTFIVNTKLALPVTTLFYILSGLFAILAVIWMLGWLVTRSKFRSSKDLVNS